MINVKYPLQFSSLGRTALSERDDHIREMIEIVLFTNPGERVNRPDFGCGVLHNIFAGNGEQLAVALQAVMAASLNRWLGDVLEVNNLEVTAVESTLNVVLSYTVVKTGEVRTDAFERRDAL
ncbi:MAG: GPW/gp25 family protein [Pirellulales bacterium]